MNTKFKLGSVLANVRSATTGASTAGEALVNKTFQVVGSQFPYVNGEVDTEAEPVGIKTDLDVNWGFKTLMMSTESNGKAVWKRFTEANDVNVAKDQEADTEVDLTGASFTVINAVKRTRNGAPICTPQSYSAFNQVTNKGSRDLGDLTNEEWSKIYESKLNAEHAPMYTYEIELSIPS